MELKIKLKVKNKEIELTKEEAQELVETLRDIFGKEKEYVPYYPYRYREWWEYPYWEKSFPKITWGDDNTGTYRPSSWFIANVSDNVQVSYSYS